MCLNVVHVMKLITVLASLYLELCHLGILSSAMPTRPPGFGVLRTPTWGAGGPAFSSNSTSVFGLKATLHIHLGMFQPSWVSLALSAALAPRLVKFWNSEMISSTGITGFRTWVSKNLHCRTELHMNCLEERKRPCFQKHHGEKCEVLDKYISVATGNFPQLTVDTHGGVCEVSIQGSVGCPH